MPNSGKLRYDVAMWDSTGWVLTRRENEKHVGQVLLSAAQLYGAWHPDDRVDLNSLVSCLEAGGVSVWLEALPSPVREAALARKHARHAEEKRAKRVKKGTP